MKVTSEQISRFEEKLTIINCIIQNGYKDYTSNKKIEYSDYIRSVLNKKINLDGLFEEIERPEPAFGNMSFKDFLLPCFEGMIISIVRKCIKNRSEIDDAKQHAICSLYQSIYYWDSERSKLSTFVHTSVKNSIFSYIKNSQKHTKTSLEQEEGAIEFYSIDPKNCSNGFDIHYYVRKAELNSDEIEIIKFALSNGADSGWQTKMAKAKKISRQAINSKFKQICKKIVESANSEIERKLIKK